MIFTLYFHKFLTEVWRMLQTEADCGLEETDRSLDYGVSGALQKHGQFITETLGAAVESIDLEDGSVFTNILAALGQIHATYQVKPHYLPVYDYNLYVIYHCLLFSCMSIIA